jgi:membrane protein DedA with SNARE-associated domain
LLWFIKSVVIKALQLEQLIDWIKDWGYLAVFLGSLVEGESVILTASSMAYLGYLSLYKIMIVAFIGTVLADQMLYFVGRHYGPGIFDRFPRLKKSAARAFDLLNRYDIGFIIGCRFIYGIRITSAIVIGTAQIPLKRFIPLNILSGFIWTIVSCVGGYLLGDIMKDIFENFNLIQKYLFIGLGILGILIVCFFTYRKYKTKQAALKSVHSINPSSDTIQKEIL